MSELLVGCGRRRVKALGNAPERGWRDLTTLDINPDHEPDVVWDLMQLPLPFPDDSFDELHAYEVLEHTGVQGDYRFFFAQFADFWRILKSGGLLCATVPAFSSRWVWGDPSHTRAIQRESLVFLDQLQYISQIGKTSMSDFRYVYKADFRLLKAETNEDTFVFEMETVKPSRISA